MTSKNFVFNRCVGEFVGHSNLVWSVCLQKDLILYSGGTNGRLIAWNAQNCKPIGSMQCQGTPTALGAMRLVVAAAGDRVIVTEVMPNGMFAPVKFATVPVINPTVPRNHPQHIINVVSHCIDADRLFVGYVDGYIRLWFQGKLAREYAVHRGEVLCIEKDGDTLFSGGSDQAVFAMNARDGKPFALYRGQHGPIRAINVFGNKLCIATGNAIRVQTVDSGDLLQRLCGHAHPIFCLLRDRNLLYSGSGDRKVFVWNLDTLWPIMEIQTGHMGRIKCMCLSSTGILYTGSSDKNIRKFSMAEAFQSLEQWKQANPGAGQPPKRQKAVDTAGTLTAGVMKDMRASQMSITELVDLLPVPQGVSSGGGGGAMDSFIPPSTNNNNNVENSWASSVRIGGSDAFLVPTVPMKTTLKEDSTDDYYGKLSLVNAGRGVLNAPDVDERALPAPPSADFVDPNFPDTPPISDGPPLPPRQGLAPEAGDQVYTAPRPPPRKPPLAPRTAPRPAGLPDPSMMSSPTFGSSVPTFAGADAAMSNTYSQPVAEGEGFVCDQCGKAYVTPTDLDIHISKRHGGVGGALDGNAGEYRAPSDSYQNLPINTSELTLEGHSTAEWENDNSYMSLPANAQMRQPDF